MGGACTGHAVQHLIDGWLASRFIPYAVRVYFSRGILRELVNSGCLKQTLVMREAREACGTPAVLRLIALAVPPVRRQNGVDGLQQ